jgi:hypothetical protein
MSVVDGDISAEQAPPDHPPRKGRLIVAGLVLAVAALIAAWLDLQTGWITAVFDAVSHLFYEGAPQLAKIRRPSQLVLVRMHLAILAGLASALFLASPWFDRHGRRWAAVFVLAYVVRAVVWIAGGDLPMV